MQPVRLHASSDVAVTRPGIGHVLACGNTVPTDGGIGYAPGCLFIQTDGSTEATIWYANVGTATSCNFDAVDLNITEAAYLSGVTLGTAAASKVMTTDASNTVGSIGKLAIGAAVPTNPEALLAVLPQAASATANQSYFHEQILATGGAITIPTGTAPVVASLNVHEPNITATGTVTVAATVRVVDAPTEGSSNYALWVDAGVTRLDGNLDMSDSALDLVVKANTAAALEVSDGTTKLAAFDSRNTVKDVATVKLTASDPTVASETAAHKNPTLELAAKTITYTGTTGTTSSFGTQLYVNAPTLTDASMMTLDAASSVHIAQMAAAGGMLTITASYMISTGVSDCYLTNAGVWTDTACWAKGKKYLSRNYKRARRAIENVLEKLKPATWKYKTKMYGTRINDRDRDRTGIVYDDLPEELRAPGDDGVSAGLLSSFALAAIKVLWQDNQELKARLARLEA